ncbi:hypothetical protein Adt_24359 [Abeliophyllum distichum]|uniref:Uncharacterized protein n=1 Tax=Abeliophyllum distichum TaxID=126358 RepID=A0ABD1SF46_9LAMI
MSGSTGVNPPFSWIWGWQFNPRPALEIQVIWVVTQARGAPTEKARHLRDGSMLKARHQGNDLVAWAHQRRRRDIRIMIQWFGRTNGVKREPRVWILLVLNHTISVVNVSFVGVTVRLGQELLCCG